MKLLIISHTEHYRLPDNTIAGWGPTIRELDELTLLFDEVIHIACLYPTPAPKSAMPYSSGKVKFVSIPPYGGPGWRNKLGILLKAPQIIAAVFRELRQADVFQFRAPTSMGVYLIPLLSLLTRKKGWFKYAGNWGQEQMPLSYAIQRWWLLRLQKRKVTINGRWPGQASHLLSFENPCLTAEELRKAGVIAAEKSFQEKLNICFAGGLNEGKGIRQLLDALALIPDISRHIGQLLIAGDGPLRAELAQKAAQLPISVVFRGFLNRSQLEEVYAAAHIICLPSASEGFPKVIAEGAAFGCIPVVTDVSAIGQYVIPGQTGFLMPGNRPEQIAAAFHALLGNRAALPAIAQRARQMAGLFTYERYRQRIAAEILGQQRFEGESVGG